MKITPKEVPPPGTIEIIMNKAKEAVKCGGKKSGESTENGDVEITAMATATE